MRRKRRKRIPIGEEAAPSHDRWLLSYSDLVTLLLAVFIVLFAMSRDQKQSIQSVSAGIHSGFDEMSVNAAPTITESKTSKINTARGSSGSPLPLDTTELRKQLEGVLGDAIYRHEITMQQTPEGLTISLHDFGFFNSGEANLLPGAEVQLIKTAQVLIQHGLEVRVEGNSDDQPIHTALFQSNWELSTARATSVLSVLVDKAGFPPNKISVAGYGPYRPVADNKTLEGRKLNRRVDLVIIEPKKAGEASHP